MCYLVRPLPADAQGARPGLPLPGERLQPRWLAAVAALLLGGVALAAFVTPAGERDPAPQLAAAPTPARAATAPAGEGTLARTALPVDDEVPSAPVRNAAGAGPCHHGL